MKKIISILLSCVMLISCFGVCSFAEGISPRWTYIMTMDDSLGFSGDTGTYTMTMECYSDVTSISATATLYVLNSRGNWMQRGTWSYETDIFSLDVAQNFTAAEGGEYKVVFEATVYSGNNSESVSKTIVDTY